MESRSQRSEGIASRDSSPPGIGRSLLMVFSVRGIGLVLGFAMSMLLADRLGAGAATDAFFLVRRMIVSANDMLKTIVSMVYVPTLVASLRSGKGLSARAFWRRHMLAFIAGSLLLSILVALAANWIIALLAPGFDAERAGLAADLLRVIVFLIPITVALAGATSCLNASKQFGVPAITNEIPRGLLVAILLLLVPPFGVMALGWGMVAGNLLVTLWVIYYLSRSIRRVGWAVPARNSNAVEQASPHNGDGRTLGRRTIAVIVGQLYAQGCIMLDLAFASTLGVGAVSVLEYGQRLGNALSALIVSSLITVIYTEFSGRASDADPAGLPRSVAASLRLGFFLLLPLLVFLWVAADVLVSIILVRGAFDLQAGTVTASVLRTQSPAIIFSFAVNMITLAVLADRSSPLLRTTCTMVCVGVVARVVFLLSLPKMFGIVGISIAGSATAGLVMVAVYGVARAHWGRLLSTADLAQLGKIVVCAAVAGGVMYGILAVPGVVAPRSTLVETLLLVATAGIGGILYLGVALLSGVEEVTRALTLLHRLRGSRRR